MALCEPLVLGLAFLHQSNLLHQSDLVVEETFFSNLASTVPGGDGAKLHMEALFRRLNYFTVGCFHLSFPCSIVIGFRAGLIALLHPNLVGSVCQLVREVSLIDLSSS